MYTNIISNHTCLILQISSCYFGIDRRFSLFAWLVIDRHGAHMYHILYMLCILYKYLCAQSAFTIWFRKIVKCQILKMIRLLFVWNRGTGHVLSQPLRWWIRKLDLCGARACFVAAAAAPPLQCEIRQHNTAQSFSTLCCICCYRAPFPLPPSTRSLTLSLARFLAPPGLRARHSWIINLFCSCYNYSNERITLL